jgi:hypothetical protein
MSDEEANKLKDLFNNMKFDPESWLKPAKDIIIDGKYK